MGLCHMKYWQWGNVTGGSGMSHDMHLVWGVSGVMSSCHHVKCHKMVEDDGSSCSLSDRPQQKYYNIIKVLTVLFYILGVYSTAYRAMGRE